MQRDRAKEHNKIVKYIKRVNKNIRSDEYLGLNRFSINMWSENMYRFSDGSGVQLNIVFKMSDAETGNSAYFIANNFDYDTTIYKYLNDFLIRCSSGCAGHYPQLHYIAYDVHSTVNYEGRRDMPYKQDDEAIGMWNWTRWNLFGEENN